MGRRKTNCLRICVRDVAAPACVQTKRGAHVPAALPPEHCGGLPPQACPLGARSAPHPPRKTRKHSPHDPQKEPTKVRPEEHKNRPLHACRSLNFFDREITSSALPGRSYGYKRPDGLPEPGYIPRAGPASSTSPWYRADSCGVHPPAPEYPAAAQWPDWPRR